MWEGAGEKGKKTVRGSRSVNAGTPHKIGVASQDTKARRHAKGENV
jgi:hypothetical protein